MLAWKWESWPAVYCFINLVACFSLSHCVPISKEVIGNSTDLTKVWWHGGKLFPRPAYTTTYRPTPMVIFLPDMPSHSPAGPPPITMVHYENEYPKDHEKNIMSVATIVSNPGNLTYQNPGTTLHPTSGPPQPSMPHQSLSSLLFPNSHQNLNPTSNPTNSGAAYHPSPGMLEHQAPDAVPHGGFNESHTHAPSTFQPNFSLESLLDLPTYTHADADDVLEEDMFGDLFSPEDLVQDPLPPSLAFQEEIPKRKPKPKPFA